MHRDGQHNWPPFAGLPIPPETRGPPPNGSRAAASSRSKRSNGDSPVPFHRALGHLDSLLFQQLLPRNLRIASCFSNCALNNSRCSSNRRLRRTRAVGLPAALTQIPREPSVGSSQVRGRWPAGSNSSHGPSASTPLPEVVCMASSPQRWCPLAVGAGSYRSPQRAWPPTLSRAQLVGSHRHWLQQFISRAGWG